MREVAVLGVGMTKFGPTDLSIKELFAQAALEAIRESNLTSRDVQALFVGNVLGDFAEGQMNLAGFLADEIGLPPRIPATRVEGACATASIAFREAFMWVASGFYDIVLVGGVEKVSSMGTPLATRAFAMATDSHYEEFCGLTFPGVFAMLTHLYANKYGISLPTLKEQMARVAVKNHHNGAMNPLAQFQAEISMEKVLNSFMVCDPLQLYDCCPFSDGAAAVVLASREIAQARVAKPVKVLGVGQGSAGALSRQKDFTVMQSRVASARQAYKMAGIEARDIDLCELHDCFTIAEIVASECLGFFEFGQGSAAVEKGSTRIGGKIPINPSGGLKSKGHPIGATGCAQVYEIVKQLRGECGKRQVDGAKIGMTDTLGGDAGTVVNLILGV
ncbi:MAG: thiolase domain-containing protein [Syntrophobacteraceae bacterium]|nr:thiolase domain-containing protein [Syntrophobacteraceae bacterium]